MEARNIAASELQWGALQIVPGEAGHAVDSVNKLGMRCYYPNYVASVPCGGPPGTRRKVLRALFPGYVFFGIEPGTDAWKCLFRAEGVVRPLMSAREELSQVPYEFIASLADQEQHRTAMFKRHGNEWPFKVGEQIRVSEGKFSGLYGELTELDAEGRIAFLLNLFGRKVPIYGMHASQVEAV